MKHRWFLNGVIIFALLSLLFITTQALTRRVLKARAQTADPTPAVVWVTPSGETETSETEEILLPTMRALLQSGATPPVIVAQVSPTAVMSSPQAIALPPPQSTVAPPLPQQGGTCISGSIIDHFHQLQSVPLTVTAISNGDVRTVQTNNGQFQFTNLPAGAWMVTLTLPENYRAFTPVTFKVTLSGQGNGCAPVRFKVESPTCVDIIKEDDLGVGLPGWVFTATMGTEVLTRTTDWRGLAHFENLRLGEWQFAGESKAGWRPVTGVSDTQTIRLEPTENPAQCRTLKFVNTQVHDSCLVARKLDVTYGEPGTPVSNVSITLSRNDGTRPSVTQQTDQTGQTTFSNLPLGGYTLEENVPSGSLAVGPTTVPITLSVASTVCQEVTFKNKQDTCLSGQKVTHLHTGVSGWVVTATHQATGETRTTTTDEGGYFRFDNLPLGIWTLWEEKRPGWTPITPAHIDVVADEPRPPDQCYMVRFKNQPPPPCLEVYKLDAYDGAGLAGWTMTLQPAYGGQSQIKQTDGIGYTRFDNLVPGDYVITETQQSGWVPITPISQTITLAETDLCKVVVFQNCQENFARNGMCQKADE